MPAQTLSEACTDPSVTATVPGLRRKRSDVSGSQGKLVTLPDKEVCADKYQQTPSTRLFYFT